MIKVLAKKIFGKAINKHSNLKFAFHYYSMCTIYKETLCIVRSEIILRILKIFIKIAVLIIFMGGCLMGFVYGFPWEHIITRYKARNYVEQTYGLTITRMRVSFLVDYPVIAAVSTKENSFDFGVYMSRSDLNNIWDNYLDFMTKYVLGRELNNYIEDVTEKRGSANILLDGNINEFTLAELNSNPKIAFEKLKNEYECAIYLNDDITEENYQVDFDEIYNIYNQIFECGLEPTEIRYLYGNDGDSYLFITIDKEDFQNITTSEDLKPYFEEVIKQ